MNKARSIPQVVILVSKRRGMIFLVSNFGSTLGSVRLETPTALSLAVSWSGPIICAKWRRRQTGVICKIGCFGLLLKA